MGVFGLLVVVVLTIYVLHRWERESRETPADLPVEAPPVPVEAPVDTDPTPAPEDDTEDEDEDEVDAAPDPLDSPAPYDSDHCLGCAKGCTYRGFRLPGGGIRDAIQRAAEIAYRDSHNGNCKDSEFIADSDSRDVYDSTESSFNPIEVARAVGRSKRIAWFENCEECCSYLRRCRDDGTDPAAPSSEPAAVVADCEVPF